MRRPRSKLQVSTFPFLAVLLCAMGSLMLLLFIMDRRAKIAARYRVAEELQTQQARTKAEEGARQAEWDKAKQQLHLTLQQQQDKLLAESTGYQHNLSDAGGKLAQVQARHGDLEQRVKDESAKIGLLHLEIESTRAGLQQADKKESMTKAELLEAAKELAELERAFQQLRALKEREKQVHSVVPYRGKRGDLRPPIYVECVREGVLFHPEKDLVRGRDLIADTMRGEVERRFGPLAQQKSTKDKSGESNGPYVLFLIRPDGIASYYKAQSALKGYQLDFGYELVDMGWVLDFTGENHAKIAPPSRPQLPLKFEDTPTLPIVAGGEPSKGMPMIAPPLSMLSPGGSGAGGGSGNVGTGYPLLAPPMGFGGASGGNVGASNPPVAPTTGFSGAGGGSGNVGGGDPLSAPPTGFPSNPPPAGIDIGIPSKNPSFVPITKTPSTFSTPATGPGGGGTGGGGSSTPDLNPIKTPIPGNSVVGQRPTTNTPGTSGATKESGGSGPPGTPGSSGSPGDSPGKSFPTYGGDPGKKPPPVSPLSKLLGNKDFVISIDCRTDAVTVNPSGLTYRWTSSNLLATDKALVDTVTNLIARRQASVRPGEPPYRPLIRFQVSPDGLRTYYHVYPLLEPLRVPMTRENVGE